MELAFATKSLRQLCESQTVADRDLGPQVAEKLRARLADLVAAANIGELVTGGPPAPRSRLLTLNLSAGFSLVLSPNHNKTPFLKGTRAVDWSKVSRVKIVKLEASDD